MVSQANDNQQYSDTDALNRLLKRLGPNGDVAIGYRDDSVMPKNTRRQVPVSSLELVSTLEHISATLDKIQLQLSFITGVDL